MLAAVPVGTKWIWSVELAAPAEEVEDGLLGELGGGVVGVGGCVFEVGLREMRHDLGEDGSVVVGGELT